MNLPQPRPKPSTAGLAAWRALSPEEKAARLAARPAAHRADADWRRRRGADTQRQAVYRWERALAKAHPDGFGLLLRPEECTSLVARVWEDYRPGSAPPRIRFRSGGRNSHGSRHEIALLPEHRRTWAVLHEVGHAILDGTPEEGPAHGPKFARLLLELFDEYGGVPKGEARHAGVVQRPRRVRFAAVAACPSPASRDLRDWQAEHRRLTRIMEDARRALAEHGMRRPRS